MSLKRKRASQAKAAPLPETPKSPSPPPWNLPFPRLPTVEDSKYDSDTELKNVADSGVLSTALLQSRELWVQGYHFPKVWKPTRRGRKDPPANSQYITTRLGVCPVVIGPHIFPDTRFLSVRKVDEKAEKAEKPPKAVKAPKPAPAPKPLPPATAPAATSTASHSNQLTVKALTEIASASPEFSAILLAVANKTATPEQHAALAQYMRAASLIPKAPIATPVTTIPTPPPRPLPPTPSMQSAPIPPVPKTTPHAPVPSPVPPRVVSTPVTRIPPPSGNLNPIPPPRPPITTPVTRIPQPSAPVNTVPPKQFTPVTTIVPPTLQNTPSTPSQPTVATPSTPSQPTPGPSLITPLPLPQTPQTSQAPPAPQTPQTPLPPAVDPMSFVEIGFELTDPGERLLIPRHTILEKFVSPQGGNNVLASFIVTLNNNTVYIPITLKLSDCPHRIWETLHKYVLPQPVVAQEMERIMKECRRFEKSVLQLQIPVDEEGFHWNGIKKEVERKKYQRKKKEEKKEDGADKEGPDSPATKKKKSLVVGLKYTPTKKENTIQKEAGTEKQTVAENDTPTKKEPEEPVAVGQ